MKTHKLLYLLLAFLLFATCKKDRNRWFKTKVQGTVIDYFDLKAVEGVKVSIVYTYDFKEYSWPHNYPPPTGSLPPCVEPDTLAQTYTDANGNFELKFPVKKKVDDCGLYNNVIHSEEGVITIGNKDYGYLLIFEKPGTDYFKQYYSLGYADKNKINVLYRIRPLITLEFKVYTLTNQNELVQLVLYSGSDFSILNGKSTPVKGINIDTTLTHKLAFNTKVEYVCDISGGQTYYSEKKSIYVQQKKYLYEIVY